MDGMPNNISKGIDTTDVIYAIKANSPKLFIDTSTIENIIGPTNNTVSQTFVLYISACFMIKIPPIYNSLYKTY